MSKEIVKPKIDIIFRMIFGDIKNRDMLKRFISDVLSIPYDDIVDLEILNVEIPPDTVDGKLSRMDIRLSLKYHVVDIEIQLRNNGDTEERFLFYWARNYSEDLKRGDTYSQIRKGIVLSILNYNLFDGTEEYHSKFVPMEENRHTILTDKMEIHICELPKVRTSKDEGDPKKLWMQFIDAESEEELDMLANVQVPEIQKGIEIVKTLSSDKLVRERARAREDAIRDYNSAIEFATRKGMEKGRTDILDALRKMGIDESALRAAEEAVIKAA
ncbi:MAG: Rpn family recombination-promoting nuclease/putative transposase [bacterium]|nr:Rpn family recombination-promoting nuclease/putative transposase [bacterium]